MPIPQKIEVVETFHQLTPYQRCMEIWTRWIKLRDQQQTSGDSNLQDTKEFMRAGEAIEVMINDLPRHQWWAIRKSRGICTVWNFPNVSVDDALLKAEDVLTDKMKKHLATRKHFN